jgi:hypothetical protein
MTTVTEARAAYVSAMDDVTVKRLALGKAIREAREQDVKQGAIAAELRLTREQVRRYQVEYEKAEGLDHLG